jgi:hypothetical protein
MPVWASFCKLTVAGLLFGATAWAQDVPRSHGLAAASREAIAAVGHGRPGAHASFASTRTISPGGSRHWWYEDYPRAREIFPERHYLQPITPPAGEDFSPVTMKWSLSGRHPLLPTVEIAGMDTWSPDTWHAPDPSPQYGHFQRGHRRIAVGAKIKRLILAQLTY